MTTLRRDRAPTSYRLNVYVGGGDSLSLTGQAMAWRLSQRKGRAITKTCQASRITPVRRIHNGNQPNSEKDAPKLGLRMRLSYEVSTKSGSRSENCSENWGFE